MAKGIEGLKGVKFFRQISLIPKPKPRPPSIEFSKR